jgi:hypothetical protein
MIRPRIEPSQFWFVDSDPVRGRKKGKDQLALVVREVSQ